MEEIIIRQAKFKDASEIAKIHVKTWQCAYKGQIPDTFLDSLSIEKRTKDWEKILNNKRSKSKTFVALLNGCIVGFASVGPSRDDDVPKEIGELWSLYVDPNNMGKGVGSALLSECLDYLRKLKFTRATLWMLTSNEKTRKWYKSKGWKIEGKTKTDKRASFELHETRYIIGL